MFAQDMADHRMSSRLGNIMNSHGLRYSFRQLLDVTVSTT